MVMPFPVQPLILGNGHHCMRDPRRQEEAVHQMVQEEAQKPEWATIPIQQAIHTQEEGPQGPMVQEEHNPPGGGNPGGNPGGSSTPPGATPPQQSGGAGNPGGSPPTTPQIHGRR